MRKRRHRGSLRPLRMTCSGPRAAIKPASRRSRGTVHRRDARRPREDAISPSARAAYAGDRGTGTVPGLQALLAGLPPRIKGSIVHPRRTKEHAHAARPAELMGAWRRRAYAQGVKIDRDAADGLHGIRVDGLLASPRQLGQAGDGLDRARLVVGEDQGREERVIDHAPRHRLGIDQALGRDLGPGDPVSHLRQPADRLGHGRVLDRAGEDVGAAAPAAIEFRQAEDRQVVRLGAAGSEDDLVGVGIQDAGDGLGRPQGAPRRAARAAECRLSEFPPASRWGRICLQDALGSRAARLRCGRGRWASCPRYTGRGSA